MKKAFLIPSVLFPYAVCFCFLSVFSDSVMENIFRGNPVFILFFILLLWFVALGCSFGYVFMQNKRFCDGFQLLKTALWIKILQIIAYVIMFCLGIAFLLTIFTAGFSLALFLLSYGTLVLSAIPSIHAIAKCKKENIISASACVVGVVCQFVFCFDIISMIIIYKKIK